MSTLIEIKAAAAKLPAEDRTALVVWLSEAKDVWEIRQAQLRHEIQLGLDDLARGEVAPLEIDEIKRQAHLRFESERGT